ncbi:NAD(P)/FAD-dependent oxidoreductase [Acetobacteraceae bacterium ESL0709]|nr:NAD(P)/FAD-dependent oxidoreductase [Acetobacteraceae bacterium ESL0697]MDF7677585.1 NAD(P)/FAD-dependent oxidoreductase [Acetobacteraceae bacterium ESL0709]
MSTEKRVVVLGGGIGGLEVAAALGRQRDAKVTLVDPNDVHIWKPVLHEFAAGTIDAPENVFPFTKLAQKFGFDFIQSVATQINRADKKLTLKEGNILDYDYLVVSIGGRINDFGTPGVQEHCLFLDSINDAYYLNEVFSEAVKQAQLEAKPLTLAIIGGGATGVQLAAEFCKAIDSVPELGVAGRKKYLKAVIIEAMPRILPAFPESVSEEAKKQFTDIGFEVLTEATVSSVDETGIKLKDGRHIEAQIRIWAAGVQAAKGTSLFSDLDLGRGGQIVVTPTLQSTKDPAIFAVGDCSRIESNPIAPTAQAARQEGRYVGHVALPALMNGTTPAPFNYVDRGAVVVLGNYNAWGMWPSKKAFGGSGMGASFAQFIHEGLYRQHQFDLTGLMHTAGIALRDHFSHHHPELISGSSEKDAPHSPK